MASFNEINNEWSMLCQECPECWSSEDLQLAAELGKTLLERNKDLENTLKHHQNIIEDNTQEIEYLTKQTVALKEVNDSRLRIYEQLEVNIQDLERANHRLAVENAVDKKLIKNLTGNVESLETRCEELQGCIDELRVQLDVLKRRTVPASSTITNTTNAQQKTTTSADVDRVASKYDLRKNTKDNEDDRPCSPDSSATQNDTVDCVSTTTGTISSSTTGKQPEKCQETQTTPSKEACQIAEVDSAMEQITVLMGQLRDSRSQYSRDQRRIMELEEQLTSASDQNRTLENQLSSLTNRGDEGMKSMHEEFTTLEEVRQGQLCQRCLRTVDNTGDCDLSSLCDVGLEDDDQSMIEALTSATSGTASNHRTSFSMEVQEYSKNSPRQGAPGGASAHLYKELVEKYEALLELHRSVNNSNSSRHNHDDHHHNLHSGDFNNHHIHHNHTDDEESGHGDSLQPEKPKNSCKAFSQTPTDFSEAETSSSGFADETSNKGTQTEHKGSLLFGSVDGDGEELTDAVDSRFRANPEYKELFRDIFNTLKKDGEKVDTVITAEEQSNTLKNAAALCDYSDNITDDSRSVLSSNMSEISASQLDPVTVIDTQPLKSTTTPVAIVTKKPERILTPYVRQPLEYLSVAVNARKRSSSRRNKKQQSPIHAVNSRSDSPVTHIVGSPTITYSGSRPNSGRRRQLRPSTNNLAQIDNAENNWNGNTVQFWAQQRQSAPSPTPSQCSNRSRTTEIEFKPSQASHDLSELKKLDKSYADVLKNANNKQGRDRHRRKQMVAQSK